MGRVWIKGDVCKNDGFGRRFLNGADSPVDEGVWIQSFCTLGSLAAFNFGKEGDAVDTERVEFCGFFTEILEWDAGLSG